MVLPHAGGPTTTTVDMMEDTTEDSTEVTLFHLTPAYTDVPSELICRATALPESPVMAAGGGGVCTVTKVH